jgi:parvulin-like peptidyl-prolyl isomerase
MRLGLCILLIGLTLIAACGNAVNGPNSGGGATPAAASSPVPALVPTDTARPTETPLPLAATVNGQPILLADYEAEVARFEAGIKSLGRDLGQEGNYQQRVLDALIDKTLMLQAAAIAGLSAPEADVQAAYDNAVNERGGQAAFESWLSANLYTPEQFRAELRDGSLTNTIQAQVAATVPAEVEQVHARHILIGAVDEADQVLADLAAGADFATIAVERSLDQTTRVNGGDLGWFPRGGLTVNEVAEAAFGLEPGQTSGVVASSLGFHVIQTLERGPHPLSPLALALLQKQAVEAWRADLRTGAVIQTFVEF